MEYSYSKLSPISRNTYSNNFLHFIHHKFIHFIDSQKPVRGFMNNFVHFIHSYMNPLPIVRALTNFYSIICVKVKLFLKWKRPWRWLQKVISYGIALGHLPKTTKNRPKKWKKLLNQFNNFFYIRNSLDLKMQDLFKTCKHRKYLKCGTKFNKKSISRLSIIEFIQ